MLKLLLFAFLLSICIPAFAQKKFTISGVVKDAATGEQLIGASVRITELPQIGTATNSYGFYSISAPDGDYTLSFTYIGYETITQKVSLHHDQSINISLPSKSELKEVVISA